MLFSLAEHKFGNPNPYNYIAVCLTATSKEPQHQRNRGFTILHTPSTHITRPNCRVKPNEVPGSSATRTTLRLHPTL